MIILDTNVASEPMKTRCNAAVAAWFDRQRPETLYLTAINLGELLVGIEAAPEGRKKQGLFIALADLRNSISNQVLPYDEAAATAYSMLAARTRMKRYTLPVADGQIAAIARVHGFAVATCDVEPFLAAGIQVINPWEEAV